MPVRQRLRWRSGLRAENSFTGETVCAHICDPVTGVTAQGSTCDAVPELAGGDPLCHRFDEFYSNVSLTLGMCVDCEEFPQAIWRRLLARELCLAGAAATAWFSGVDP